MNTETDRISFGRYLKSKRLEKGISLKVVAGETRIGLNTLQLIENEDLGKLPAEVFTKGFLRAYAKVIGADGQEAVERYLSDLRVFREAEKYEADLFKLSTRFWARLMLALALLGCIITGTIYLFPGTKDREHAIEPGNQQTLTEADPATVSETPPAAEPTPPPENISEKLLLKVAAVKKTWMKVQIDNQNFEAYQLNPGDHLELEAVVGFNILVGDAKGIKLTLNDKAVHIPGKSGQVRTIQVP